MSPSARYPAVVLFLLAALPLLTAACAEPPPEVGSNLRAGGEAMAGDSPYLLVLGTAQDGGLPQAGCRRDCCRRGAESRRLPSSLAIIDPSTGERWIIDASPALPEQLALIEEAAPRAAAAGPILDGIFLTHAHVGHYAGLLHFGREIMGARQVPVHVMPRMAAFLRAAGPWEQLVRLENIALQPLADGEQVVLNARLTVTPFLVPHRDEYSETVGFAVQGPRRRAIYLPDIDAWQRYEGSLLDLVAGADMIFVDGTFHGTAELPGRNLAEIPHPLMTDTAARLAVLPGEQRLKVRFIHLNHSNPAADPGSSEAAALAAAGLAVAREGERHGL